MCYRKEENGISYLCWAFMQITHTAASLSVNNHRWHLEEGEMASHDFHICIKLSQVPPHKLLRESKHKSLFEHTHQLFILK